MREQVPFINREEELSLIETLLGERNTRRIVCIEAPGGIGKTRFLQEIYRRYAPGDDSQATWLITDIIDFDDHSFHLPKNMARKIAQMLGEKYKAGFDLYQQKAMDLQKMRSAGVSADSLKQKEAEVIQAYVECFNSISDQRRVMLRLDTTDALTQTDFWNDFAEKGALLKNYIILIAGRNASNIGILLQEKLGQNVVLLRTLLPLKEQASESYLQQKLDLLHMTLKSELDQKILSLAEGRPILIDLAVEWLARDIPLKWLVEMSLKDLQSLSEHEKRERQQELERRLVNHIADTDEMMDWLILAMSRVYPLKLEIVKTILEIPEEEAKALFEEAKNYVFVKQLPDGRISLHDEMRRMVNEYVWPEIDPDGDRRRDDSKFAVQYLTSEIHTLTQNIRKIQADEEKSRKEGEVQSELAAFLKRESLEREIWMLKEQLLAHSLAANPNEIHEGVKIFINIFEEATRAYRYAFRKSLLEHVEQYTDKLSPDQRYEVDIRRAKYLLDAGQYPDANELLKNIEAKLDLQPEQRIETLIQQANVEVRLGKLQQAIPLFEQAVAISNKEIEQAAQTSQKRKEFEEWLVKSETGLGWAYRLTNDFKKAGEHYQQALNLAKKIGAEKQQILLYNNLGFAYAYYVDIPNHRDKAFVLCEQALTLAKKLGNKRLEGMAYSTMGCITYMAGRFDEALSYFQYALDIFEPADDHDWLSTVYSWRGALYMAQGNTDEAEKGVRHSLKLEVQRDRPLNLARLAHILISQEKIEKAQHAIDECRQLALDLPDVLYQIVSLRDMARMAVIKREYQRCEELEQFLAEYKQKWGEPKDLRALGMLHLNLGKLALGQSNQTKAIEHLESGFLLLAKEERYGKDTPKKFIDQIEQFMVNYLEFSSEQIREIGEKLVTFWKKEGLQIEHPDVQLLLSGLATWERAEK